MRGLWHALWLIGVGIAAGFAIGNLVPLLWFALDVLAAGRVARCSLWPDPYSLTVWTGEDWVTVTVLLVAFGRWGVALCRDRVPRRAQPVELIERARTEQEARGRARELVRQILGERTKEPGAMFTSLAGPLR